MKYGGLSETEAMELVTSNPACMLHLDSHMGSIAVGKDADVVLWNDNPLSICAKAENAFVDGREYFSLKRDQELRQQRDQERQRLMQAMLAARKAGAPSQAPRERTPTHWTCDTLGQGGELSE